MGEAAQPDLSAEQELDRLVSANPSLAIKRARALLVGADGMSRTAALAHSAVGRSLFELGQLEEAMHATRRALELADDVADDAVSVRIAMSGAAVFAEGGEIDEAVRALDSIAGRVGGTDLGRVEMQRAYVMQQAGRLAEAIGVVDAAEPLLSDGRDDVGHLRLMLLRGLISLQRGEYEMSLVDFERAEELAVRLDQSLIRAMVVSNRAVAMGRSRRLAEAQKQFTHAADLYVEAGNPSRAVSIMQIDRAEVMMHAGLTGDAIEASRAALDLVAGSGNVTLVGDANLLLARALLAAGRYREAMVSAGQASTMFAETGRVDMESHAQSIDARAALAMARGRDACRRELARAGRVGDALRASGWASLADELAIEQVTFGRKWQLFDEIRVRVEELRRRSSSDRRDRALARWYAEAVAREAGGDRVAAMEACHGGLSVLDGIVAEASSLEERSAAMRIGNDLSQMLIELAVDDGDSATALAAAEGTRARALHNEQARTARHTPLMFDAADRLRSKLTGRLGDRTLVEWIVVRDEVWAVVLDERGSRLVNVASSRDVVRARDRIVVWLDLAAADPDGSSSSAVRAATALDELLLHPLGLPSDVGVVMVPVGMLHGVPWSGLPSLASRPMVLTPNAQVWLEADHAATRPIRRIGMIVGPDLERTDLERAAIERAGVGATVAIGAAATAATVLTMLERSDLVHIAAHGTFRADHPLLSTLRLEDGEATMYEAVPNRVGARLVILSSCEGGAQGTADGSEVLGLSSVLLARGAAAVLAPLTAVRELECAEFVAEVLDEMAGGESVACAVAAVRQRWLADDDLSRWAVASSFTCFGSGAVTVATPT